MTPETTTADGIDLSARAFWDSTAAEREEAFAILRREPIRHFAQPVSEVLPDMEPTGNGYWAVTRHADVVAVSREPQTFCSAQGIAFDELPPQMLQLFNSFLVMDDPDHRRLRGLVHAAFSPKQIRRIEDRIGARARQVVDELLEAGHDGDFVSQVSSRLPMATLWDIWGLPESERPPLMAAVDKVVGYADPDVLEGVPPAQALFENAMFLREFAGEYAARRRAEPTDDLMTALVQAEVDGHSLTDDEIQGFWVLLAIAGLDTTRHTTSHAMHALTRFPQQRALLIEDLDGRIDTAVEEFVRWASPVMTFRRTVTRDTELDGTALAEGDKVVLFYPAANFDEAAFDDPRGFDVLRNPNRHVGYGGGGPHYCLGNQLARTQLKALFRELLDRAPRIEVGEPELLVSSFIHGVKRMPYRLEG